MTAHVVFLDIDDAMDPAHVARMADALRSATSWSLDRANFIPTLRYDGIDGTRRVIVVENCPFVDGFRRLDRATQEEADTIRTAVLATLSAPRSSPEELADARRRLKAFATAAAHVVGIEGDESSCFWAATPWHAAHDTIRTGARSTRPIPDDLIALAPCIVSIGDSGDSNLKDTTLGLYGDNVMRGPADAVAALRAMAVLRG